MKSMRILAGVIALSAGSSALAQGVPANVSVADRSRPDYDPIGGRIGSFRLLPKVDLTAQYDDNVFADENGKVGDYIFVVRPELRVQSLWARHSLNLRSYYMHDFHGKSGSEDISEYGGRADLGLDILRNTGLRLFASADRLAEDRTDVNNIATARSPIKYDVLTTGATFTQDFNYIGVEVDGSITKANFHDAIAFDDSIIGQDYRDATFKRGGVTLTYEFRGGLSLLGRVGIDRLNYRLDPPDVRPNEPINVDRDSDGLTIEGGLRLDLSNLIFGDIRVGYLRRKYDQPLSGARFLSASGLSISADVLWNITPLTSIRFNASRAIEETSSTVTAGNTRTQGRISIDHELLRQLVLNGAVRVAKIKPIKSDDPTIILNTGTELDLQAGATYYINRNLRLKGTLRRSQRTGSGGSSYKANTASATLTVAM
jgi:hypothetical protein